MPSPLVSLGIGCKRPVVTKICRCSSPIQNLIAQLALGVPGSTSGDFTLNLFPNCQCFSIRKIIQLPFLVGVFGEIFDYPSDPGRWGGGGAPVISWPGTRDAKHPTLCRTVLHSKELSCPCSLNLL